MKILLLGKNGQVGRKLLQILAGLGEITAPARQEMDLTDESAIRRKIRRLQPDLIVNAAAYNFVDKAEEEEHLARTVNAVAPRILAEEAARNQAALVHYSTDYVFDGRARRPYKEDDLPNPLSVYGKTKLEGEMAIQEAGCAYLIFRTSWLYSLYRKNMLLTLLQLASEGKPLQVVDDQHGIPTWAGTVAAVTRAVLLQKPFQAGKAGLYNLTPSGETTWYHFAVRVIDHYQAITGRAVYLQAISTAEFPTAAKRPAYSVLCNEKIKRDFNLTLDSWERILTELLKGISM